MLVGAVEISKFGGQSANEQIYRTCLDQYRLIGKSADGPGMSTQGEAAAKRPGELFSPRTLLAIIAIGTAAFVGMVYLEMFGTDDPDFEIGPSTYSSSALGHKALMETLRRLDVPVVVSRFRTAEKAGSGSLLVLAEPDDSDISEELLDGLEGSTARPAGAAEMGRPARRVQAALGRDHGHGPARRRRRGAQARWRRRHGEAPQGHLHRRGAGTSAARSS